MKNQTTNPRECRLLKNSESVQNLCVKSVYKIPILDISGQGQLVAFLSCEDLSRIWFLHNFAQF